MLVKSKPGKQPKPQEVQRGVAWLFTRQIGERLDVSAPWLLARTEIGEYFRFYDTERPHQALGYRTPAQVYGNPVESLSGGMIESLTPIITRTTGPALNGALILSK